MKRSMFLVIIFNSLANSFVSTKFYKRKGAPLTYNNLTARLLLVFVYAYVQFVFFYNYTSKLLMHKIKQENIMYSCIYYNFTSPYTFRASVDALCRDGAGEISRERLQRGRLTRQETTS